MKSEDGTGSRHALWVLKEMWDCHPTYFIQLYGQITSVICFLLLKHKAKEVPVLSTSSMRITGLEPDFKTDWKQRIC